MVFVFVSEAVGTVVLLKLPEQLKDFIEHSGFLLNLFFECVFSSASGGSSRVPKIPYNLQ